MPRRKTPPKTLPKTTLDAVRKSFNRTAPVVDKWNVDLGPYLNRVLGHSRRGLENGAMIELSGLESTGKSSIAAYVAGLFQQQGELWEVVWLDLENSFRQPETEDEGTYQQRRGLICHQGSSQFHLAKPYLISGKKAEDNRPASAEELCEEVERLLLMRHAENPKRRFFVVVDSVAALATQKSLEAERANMNTKVSVASFLSTLLPKWSGLMPAVNGIVLFINQIRMNPGAPMFTNPEYRPGGKALAFFSHVCADCRRFGKKSRIMSVKNPNRQIGIIGNLRATKNKSGGNENDVVQYLLYYNGKTRFQEKKD